MSCRSARRLIVSSTVRIGVVLALGAIILSACGNNSTATRGTTKTERTAPRVLLVGDYRGIEGSYRTIQAAVKSARSGDWILVAPGDYHETADQSATTPIERTEGGVAGVLITTPEIHLRGMDRNSVIVDGDKAGAPEACDPDPVWQNFGTANRGTTGSYGQSSSKHYGRNGIVVFKADKVSVENLTACNFLSGSGDAGNEIWWDGGDGSGQIGIHGYTGDYLTATTTYYGGESTAAAYGIFSSNAVRTGLVERALRKQLQRLRDVRGCLPAGLRRDHRERMDGVQRPRLFGNEFGRRGGDRELPVRQERGRTRHQHGDRRRTHRLPRTARVRTGAPVR